MSTLTTIRPAGPEDHHAILAEHLRPRFLDALRSAGPGQRLRVTTLPEPVMEAVCAWLQGEGRWAARVLAAGASRGDAEAIRGAVDASWKASATKLIELRNTLEEPLLVFLPPSVRTAAEDSLDIATFTELSLANVASGLVEALYDEIPEPLRGLVQEEIGYLWSKHLVRNEDVEVEYLLTVRKNGGTAAAAGGALYVFGLLPDFRLFERGSTRFWLTRNIGACERLGETNQPLQARIGALKIKPGTLQNPLFAFLRDRHADDIAAFAREIACDPSHRPLALDRWEFLDDAAAFDLRLVLAPLSLPKQTEDPVLGTQRMPVMNVGDKSKDVLKVAFRSIPNPSQHPSWKMWRVQILTVGAQPSMAWESNSFPKPEKGSRGVIGRNIKAKDLSALDEGTYTLKVDGYDENGALLTKPKRLVEDDPTSRAENESEPFLVVRGDVPVEPEDVRSVFVSSLLEAWARVAAKCLGGKDREAVPPRADVRGSWDQPIGVPPKGDVRFELESAGFAGYTVRTPAILRRVELSILEEPDHVGTRTLSFVEVRKAEDVEVKKGEGHDLGASDEAATFLAARRELFDAIRRHHFEADESPEENRARRTGLVETADLARHGELIERYARAYTALAQAAQGTTLDAPKAAVLRAALATLDLIELRWRPTPGDPGRAFLVAPTHPLRLLWHLAHTRMCQEAVLAWQDGTQRVPAWRPFLDQLVYDLMPMNLPMALFNRRGRAFVEHAPLTPFWPFYLPDRAENDLPVDATAARDHLLYVMGFRDRELAVTTVDPQDLADRLFEYVEQHPYVEQLCLDVFNPGDGRLVADVLRHVEALRFEILGPDAPSLRYAVRLFASARHAGADGLESLLDPERQVGEQDEFTLASNNHLLPKLVFAQNSLADFLEAPERYAAHVSILLEQFAVRGTVRRVDGLRRGSFVGGLVQEPDMQMEALGGQFGWMRGLSPRARRKATASEELIRGALDAAQRIQASFALGLPAKQEEAPVITLQLSPVEQALLKRVHDVSDWVLTVDRSLGIEFFDSPASARESGYLLDYAPEYLQEDRQRVLLTTRSTLELDRLMRPVLDEYGLELREGDEAVILDTLRSLSGRLALRMESSGTQAAEVVGLLLARWLLDRADLLDHRLVVPLDAHRAWFEDANDDGEAASRHRADLLLVGFAPPQTIRLDVVEVKLRRELSAPERSELYAKMRHQTQNTVRLLRDRFALDLYPDPRADELLRAKELAGALAFYARRANRYDLLSADETGAALAFLERLDDGYTLDLRTLGVLFEHRGHGMHIDEEEPGFPVYRFGGDKAKQFFAYAVGRFAERTSRSSDRRGRARSTEPPPAPVAAETFQDTDLDSFRSVLSLRPPRPAPASSTPYISPRADPPPSTAREPVAPVATTAAPPAVAPPQPAPAPARSAPTLVSAEAPPRVEAPPQPETPPAPAASAPPPVAAAPTPAPPATSAPPAPAQQAPAPDVLLGASEMTPQYGLLGKSGSQKVALDLNGCNTVSLFGVQGFGKSYTLGVIAEMAAANFPGINALPSPLATVIFHYHKGDDYEPELVTAIAPNRKQSEVDRLLRDYGARPAGLGEVLLLTPEAKVEQRRREYPGIAVEPIKFSSAELKNDGWKFLLGAYGNDALYLRQLNAILRRHREVLTIEKLREELADAELSKGTQRLVEDRLKLAEPYIDDTRSLGSLLRPGRTIIVDLRDDWIEKDEALELFVVMMRIFAAQKAGERELNKLIVFDEVHKYIAESELIGQLVETIRQMRHHATSVVLASQDPLSVPRVVIELSTVLVLHRMTSPQWLKHLKSAIVALEGVEESQLAALLPGEALVWAQRSTDKRFTQKPMKVNIRPRVTQHGGGTKTAVAGVTVR
jgi:hypothetical protein